MQIKIAQRYRPYSHSLGDPIILPGSILAFQIYPALIRVISMAKRSAEVLEEIPLFIKGPVKDFTVQQDLEKGEIHVWGHSVNGYFRYRIFPNRVGFSTVVEKSPTPEFQLPYPAQDVFEKVKFNERLSLGSHKAQDWNLIRRRADLTEILPLWHRLGLFCPKFDAKCAKGTLSLLERCFEAVEAGKKLEIAPALMNLFKVGFVAGFCPSLEDTQHQGFDLSKFDLKDEESPLVLLSQGCELIRSLFIRAEKESVRILPCLSPEFHCGRMLGVECGSFGMIDFEWTKKMIRRMIFRANLTGEIAFQFQKEVRSYRVRRCNEQDRGLKMGVGEKVSVEAGQLYLFDQFES